ncbi:MAG: 3-hydroxyacyl-CoA dehydrogenase NAD-binding domain-containing protein [bacterium]|nr:3-hydroxyacyl-CoA dehydrogenase NAD-binding domain-containing protein [bacterium]
MGKNVLVVGGGTMGQGIALVCALAGYQISIVDLPAVIPGIRGGIEKYFGDRIKKGKMSISGMQEVMERVRIGEDLLAVDAADWVIEAVPEEMETKRALFVELEKRMKTDAMVCTTTSSLSVTAMASGMRTPRCLIGMHFFNPATVMPLVEVVRTCWTDDAMVERAFRFVQSIQKFPVLVKDTPGFIVNRIARSFTVESMKIVNEGIATPRQVDRILRLGGNFKMGPFELMDMIGIDVNFAVTRSIFRSFFEEPRFRPQILQQELTNAGRLGRKTGHGVYSYETPEKKN